MNGSFTMKTVISHANFSLLCFLFVCFILPIYCGSAVTMVCCASILSAYVAVLPVQFRSRNGSLITAICLITAMWFGAAVITAMSLAGEIRN